MEATASNHTMETRKRTYSQVASSKKKGDEAIVQRQKTNENVTTQAPNNAANAGGAANVEANLEVERNEDAIEENDNTMVTETKPSDKVVAGSRREEDHGNNPEENRRWG